jgi:hypothetical protein
VVDVLGLSNYKELCRGYFYKGGAEHTATSGNHLVMIGDGKSFYLMVSDPYDYVTNYNWRPGTQMARYPGFYFVGELKVPHTYDELPYRSVMAVDSGYAQNSTYGYNYHSEIGPQAVHGTAVGNSSDVRVRTGKSFISQRAQQPLISGGNANKVKGVGLGYLLWYGMTSYNQGVSGFGGIAQMGAWSGCQMLHLSHPIWACGEGTTNPWSGLWGQMPGMFSLSMRTGSQNGLEFVYPLANGGSTTRQGLLVRAMVEQATPASGIRAIPLGTTPTMIGGGTDMTPTIAFDITGPWR